MNLRNRLGRIYGQPAGPSVPALRSRLEKLGREGASPSIAEFLGGSWRARPNGRVLTVERNYSLDHRHGSVSLDSVFRLSGSTLELLADDPAFLDFDPRGFLFLDTETTGLSGGAGTYVFLVGIGYFDDDSFRMRQFFLPELSSEKAFLQELCETLDKAPGSSGFSHLITFNGKAYDLNLLATRFILNRLDDPFRGLPHLDLIYPGRVLWRGCFENCALQTLERHLLGLVRRGDIPSHLIPATYFRFLRTGACRPFASVLEHNRLDVMSMAALLTVAARVVDDPVRHPQAQPLGAARIFRIRGLFDQAARVLESAARPQAIRERLDWIQELGRLKKRLDRKDEALNHWSELLELHPAPPVQVYEECAKLQEHHQKDFGSALGTVEDGLQLHPGDPLLSLRRHRLECKIAGRKWYRVSTPRRDRTSDD